MLVIKLYFVKCSEAARVAVASALFNCDAGRLRVESHRHSLAVRCPVCVHLS